MITVSFFRCLPTHYSENDRMHSLHIRKMYVTFQIFLIVESCLNKMVKKPNKGEVV
jgi:hypothetical protein